MPRAPKPAEIKKREGNPGKRNLSPNDAPHVDRVAADRIPEPPDFVKKIKGAEARWDSLCVLLLRMGVMGQADTGVVGRYAVALEIFSRTAELLESDGLVMSFESGAKQVSASLSAYIKVSDQCLKLEQQLGLTPSARTKVTTWGGNRPPPSDADGAEPDAAPATAEELGIDNPITDTFKFTGT